LTNARRIEGLRGKGPGVAAALFVRRVRAWVIKARRYFCAHEMREIPPSSFGSPLNKSRRAISWRQRLNELDRRAPGLSVPPLLPNIRLLAPRGLTGRGRGARGREGGMRARKTRYSVALSSGALRASLIGQRRAGNVRAFLGYTSRPPQPLREPSSPALLTHTLSFAHQACECVPMRICVCDLFCTTKIDA
jgi:hypothetical protein